MTVITLNGYHENWQNLGTEHFRFEIWWLTKETVQNQWKIFHATQQSICIPNSVPVINISCNINKKFGSQFGLPELRLRWAHGWVVRNLAGVCFRLWPRWSRPVCVGCERELLSPWSGCWWVYRSSFALESFMIIGIVQHGDFCQVSSCLLCVFYVCPIIANTVTTLRNAKPHDTIWRRKDNEFGKHR